MNRKIVYIILFILIHSVRLSFASNDEKKISKKNKNPDLTPLSYGFLPSDVQTNILSYLRGKDVGVAAQVSKSWNYYSRVQFGLDHQGLPNYNLNYETEKKIYSGKLLLEKNFCSKLFFNAIETGNVELVHLLYNQFKFDLNHIKNSKSQSPLIVASFKGHENIVSFLLEKGADVNVTALIDGNEFTPLTVACGKGNVNIVKLLLKDKKNNFYLNPYEINTSTKITPLYAAVTNQHPKIVKILLDIQNDPYLFSQSQENSPFNPLFFAARNGNIEIINLLLNANAPINHLIKYDVTTQHNGATVVMMPKGSTALDQACIHGNFEAVKLLIDRGAKIDLFNQRNPSTIFILSQQKSWEILKYLLEAHKNFYSSSQDQILQVLDIFHSAIIDNKIEFIQYLIQYDSHLLQNQNELKKLLHQASSNGYKEIVNLLLEPVKNESSINEYGFLLLGVLSGASDEEKIELVEFALNEFKKLEPSIQNDLWEDFSKIFFFSLRRGQLNIVQKFITFDPSLVNKILLSRDDGYEVDDYDKKDDENENTFLTPLYVASKFGHFKIVEFFLNYSVDVNQGLNKEWNLKEKKYQLKITPLFIALKNGYSEIAEILLDAGAKLNMD